MAIYFSRRTASGEWFNVYATNPYTLAQDLAVRHDGNGYQPRQWPVYPREGD